MSIQTDIQNKFFQDNLESIDPEITKALQKEYDRQSNQIELIASENIVSLAVMQAQGSLMTNKYAEGYPGKRYYGGCEFYDVVENLAIDRAKKIFNCKYANVQPNSGSQANQAVMLALIQPHDSVVGMSLDAGGHLTHGAAPIVSGKWFNAIQYGVKKEDSLIDFDQIEKLAVENKAILIISGGSAYTRIIDYKKIPDFYEATVSGHKGEVVYGYINKKPILCARGRLHYYEGYSFDEIGAIVEIFNYYNPKLCIITNSSGCLNTKWKLGSYLIIKDFIDFSFIYIHEA